MSLQAPAIIDVRHKATVEPSPLMRWVRGIGVRQVRLVCGLVMFSYIFSHFFNHALGNYSYELMETWLAFHIWWWRTPIVNYTLYWRSNDPFSARAVGALPAPGIPLHRDRDHAARIWAEHSASDRRPLRDHRLGGAMFDRRLRRTTPWRSFGLLGRLRPYKVAVQFTLLTVAWIHACIGLYFWLRLSRSSDGHAPFLLCDRRAAAAACHDRHSSWRP